VEKLMYESINTVKFTAVKSEDLKKELLSLCEKFVKDRIQNAENALENAQQSANSEERSTAGDKHDTARAMSHLEQEKSAKYLDEAVKLKRALSELLKAQPSDVIDFGSLVVTNQGTYFIALSIGAIKLNDINYFIVSPTSPIAIAFKGLKAGDKATFNGRNFIIEEVC
jgi:transcription elongation GreA/GreB family factor